MAMFKQVADIKTADMLNLPVPEVEYHNIAVKPSQVQKEMVASLGERAERIRGGGVDSSVDNMLKVTNDGRKLALDQRMMNPMLPDEESSKVNACVNEVFRIWEENSDKKLTQLLFLRPCSDTLLQINFMWAKACKEVKVAGKTEFSLTDILKSGMMG